MAAAVVADLTQAKKQCFSLPKTLINYSFDNSQLELSQNLIKCCKLFKLLHLKKNEARIIKMDISISRYYIDGGFSWALFVNHNSCRFKINTEMKSIQILHTLKLFSTIDSGFYLSNLLPKLDLSLTKKIVVDLDIELKEGDLKIIIHPSLEEFILNCFPCKDINPALLIFQKCPNIKEISLKFYDQPSTPVLTKNILKEIVETKVENKIKMLRILPVSEVDLDDFLKLIDNYLAADCRIYFTSEEPEIFASYEQMFEKIVEIRKNESKKIQVSFRCERAFYEKIL